DHRIEAPASRIGRGRVSKAKRASRGDGGPLRITTTNDEVSDTPSKIAKQAFNWRAHLAVHPAAEAFPLLPKKELKELAGDIKHKHRQTGIVLSFSEAGAKKQLLDGRNRLDALAMFGLLQVDDLGRFYVKKQDGGLEQIEEQHIVVGDAEKHAYSLNLHRRHFTREQKRELIARLLKENPEASGRQISKQIKADNKTLAAVRSDLERREELPHVDIRTDTK